MCKTQKLYQLGFLTNPTVYKKICIVYVKVYTLKQIPNRKKRKKKLITNLVTDKIVVDSEWPVMDGEACDMQN